MSRKLLIAFATVAGALASAATYKVDLPESTEVHGAALRAGHYKVDIAGDKAVFHSGKNVVAELPVKVESSGNKFDETSCLYGRRSDGTMKLEKINIGGSRTTLDFAD